MTLTTGSLFSGAGMLDRAVEEVFGARTAWVSEIDRGACKVLAHRYPGVPNLGDITTIDWSTVEPVDIIAGGSPCQDLSSAGRRAGMTDGTRSNLWVQMREAIAHVQPTYVVWENVRGALSAHAASDLEHCPGCMGDPQHGGPALRALGRVLGDLADLGFDAEVRGLRAADVGACHGRFRVFLLAWRREASADAHLAGLQGLADQAGAAPAERHGHPVAGAGRPDLTLLPTPASNIGQNGGPQHPAKRRAGGHSVSIEDAIHGLALLPTPTACVANDSEGPETWLARRERVKETANNGNGMGMPLTIAVQSLPTPTTGAFNDKEENNHANTTDPVPGQDLRDMWEDVQPEEVQWTAGGPGALPLAAQLLPVVREHQGGCDEGRPSLAGTEARGADVLGVLHDGRPARSPRRPEPGEQRPGEPADALRIVPPETALAGGPREAAGVEPLGCGCEEWGHYAPATHRHELALGRVAPSPVEVGPSGKPRLSAFAVEWMMMLPAGWITDVPGVTRTEALRMLGNGAVVPQAEHALRLMMNRIQANANV